jgi:hypothetical protein
VLKKNEGKEITGWTITDIKTLMKPWKIKTDRPMPTTKSGLIDLYNICMSRNQCKTLMGPLKQGNTSEAVGGVILPQIQVEETVRQKEIVFCGKSEV